MVHSRRKKRLLNPFAKPLTAEQAREESEQRQFEENQARLERIRQRDPELFAAIQERDRLEKEKESEKLRTPIPEPKKELTLEERREIAKNAPEGSIIDKFGNVSQPTEEEMKKRILGTQELAAGAGVTSAELERRKVSEQQRQQAIQKAIQLAQQGILSQEELQALGGADIDVSQALGAGAVGAAPGVLAGIATGAISGAVGGPIGIVGGAIIGAIGGFTTAVISNIRGQQSGQFAADRQALSKGITALNSIITDTNRNPQNAVQNVELFYKTLSMIDQAHAKTWKDSQEDLNRFLGKDGTQELARFEVFDQQLRQLYILRFNTALAQPDPSQVSIPDEELLNFINEEG